MRDPLTPPPADYLDHAAARRIVVGVLPRAIHARADPRPRASGPRRRRPDAIGANHHRRRRLAARPAALSGLYVVDLHRVDRGRPILGGFIAEHVHWSWIFWFNLPLCGLAFLLTHNVLQRLPRHDRRHRLDLLGALLMVGAAIALMLALSWGGRRYAWGSPPILTVVSASIALWALFAWRVMAAEEPFIPLSVLRDGAVRVGTASGFFAVGLVIALTIVLPLYAQLALGLTVSESAWTIIALQGAATLTSIVGGRLLVRFTHYKRVPVAGLLLSIAALVPLAMAPTGLSPWAALGLIALVGLGLGPTFPFTVVVVQNAVALHQLGVATGTMNFFRAMGSTFIVSGFGAMVLAATPVVTRGLSAGAVLAGADAAEAFRWVFAAAIVCLAVALASILALEERPLRGSARPAKRVD